MKMRTKQARDEFLASRCRLRPNTVRDYGLQLSRFEAACPELPQTPQPIRDFLGSLPVTDETARKYYRALSAMYRELAAEHPGLVNPMPSVKMAPLRRKVMRTFTLPELHQLLSQPLSVRDHCLLTMLLDTGIRAGELASMTWQDVFPEFVIVSGKSGEGMVPVSTELRQLLMRLRQRNGRDSHVFMGKRGPLRYEGVYKVVRKLCHQAGITGRRASPHTFRHTAGTLFIEAGCDTETVRRILRHSSIQVTQKYLHQNIAPIIRKHEMFSPLKMLRAAAQGMLFEDEAVAEAERMMEK